MADGASTLEAMIARCRAIPGIAKRAAPDVASAVHDELGAQIAQGVSPTGEAWAPRKNDGGRALAHAGAALKVAPIGTRIFARLSGPVARHDSGRAKGGVIRKILPSSDIPPKIAARVREVLNEHFKRAMKGGA